MKFEKRVRALEARLISDPVVLSMPDGSQRELRGPGDFLLRLVRSVFGNANPTPEQSTQLDLIRQCVYAKERGGGHLVELLQVFLHAQADGLVNR